MSGLDESGIPLQERIEVENIYEEYKRAKGTLKATRDKFMKVMREEQLRVYALMAEAEQAFVFDDIESHEVILIDEDFSLQRESHRGIFNRLVHRIGGRRSENHSRRNNRSTRESGSPTIDFVA